MLSRGSGKIAAADLEDTVEDDDIAFAKMPLIGTLFIILMIPAAVILTRGIIMNGVCEEERQACYKECEDNWKERLATLEGAEKYQVRDQRKQTERCYTNCDVDSDECAVKATALILGAGLLFAALVCAVMITISIESLKRREKNRIVQQVSVGARPPPPPPAGSSEVLCPNCKIRFHTMMPIDAEHVGPAPIVCPACLYVVSGVI